MKSNTGSHLISGTRSACDNQKWKAGQFVPAFSLLCLPVPLVFPAKNGGIEPQRVRSCLPRILSENDHSRNYINNERTVKHNLFATIQSIKK